MRSWNSSRKPHSVLQTGWKYITRRPKTGKGLMFLSLWGPKPQDSVHKENVSRKDEAGNQTYVICLPRLTPYRLAKPARVLIEVSKHDANNKTYQGRGEGWGRRYGGGGGEGRLYTYTVTTRMTPALRWAAMKAILMFHNCEGQSHKTVSTNHNVWRERRAKAESSRGPSAYQPDALPLGHTGSIVLIDCCWSVALRPQKP